jgi:hypothetical protein
VGNGAARLLDGGAAIRKGARAALVEAQLYSRRDWKSGFWRSQIVLCCSVLGFRVMFALGLGDEDVADLQEDADGTGAANE